MVNTGLRNLLLTVLAGVALSACGGPEDTSVPHNPSVPPTSNPNFAPTIAGTPSTSATAGTAWSFQATAEDRDGDTLTFNATGLPPWASLNSQTGLVAGTPQETDVGTTADITVSVSDGKASAALPSFKIVVASGLPDDPPPPPPPPPPTNSAPVISGTPPATVQATQSYSFTPSASDADGQTLTFSIANKPVWANFNTATGQLFGTPNAQQVTVFSSIVISVSDGSASTSLPAFSINVTAPPNRAPTINGSPAGSVTAMSAYSFRPTASDPDGQTLSYSIQNKPSWATFSTTTGRLSGTPSDAHANTMTSGIVITVSDGSLTASLPAFAIVVDPRPNDVPTISGSPTTSAIAGESYSFTPAAQDANGDTLAFAVQNKPAWLNFNSTTGALTGTAVIGTYANIIISVNDGRGGSASLTAFTITVTGATPSGTANLSWDPPTQYTDGSTLAAADLSGYRIYHGTSANDLSDVITVSGADTRTYLVDRLVAGTHYFAVSAVTASGAESALSGVGSKTIP